MAQWIYIVWYDGFVPLLYEKSGALAIVEMGLTAGQLLVRRNFCKVRKFKFCIFDF